MSNVITIGQFLSFGIGGADKAAYCLTKGLVESGIKVIVFYNESSFPKRSPQVDSEVLLSRYNQCCELGVPMVKITNLIDLNNYNLDILNTHRSGDDTWFVPGFENTLFNFKVVETNFHGHSQTKADIRIFPSHEMIKNKRVNGLYKVIPNPIMNKLTGDNLRDELDLQGKFVFGRIARPSRDIYSTTCLEAFKLIENNDVHFLYVAPHQIAIDDAANFKIKNITFIDQTIDEVYISKLYNTFDVLCHSTPLGETFGNTIAEAMIHGKPIISHWGNNWPQAQREVIGEEKIEYICQDAPDQYSNLMVKLLSNKHEYNDYSSYVKRRADKLYDYREVAKRYIEVYQNL